MKVAIPSAVPYGTSSMNTAPMSPKTQTILRAAILPTVIVMRVIAERQVRGQRPGDQGVRTGRRRSGRLPGAGRRESLTGSEFG
jgi:hypothetical protein